MPTSTVGTVPSPVRRGRKNPSGTNATTFAPTCTSTVTGSLASTAARSRSGTQLTARFPATGVRIIHTHGSVPPTIPASATVQRRASARPHPRRTRRRNTPTATPTNSGTPTAQATSTSPQARHT